MPSLFKFADDTLVVPVTDRFGNTLLRPLRYGLAVRDNDRRDGEAELHTQAVTSSPLTRLYKSGSPTDTLARPHHVCIEPTVVVAVGGVCAVVCARFDRSAVSVWHSAWRLVGTGW